MNLDSIKILTPYLIYIILITIVFWVITLLIQRKINKQEGEQN